MINPVDTDVLWGGVVTGFAVDLASAEARLSVRVTDSGNETGYTLVLSGVSELRIDRTDPQSWEYTELTEVHVDDEAVGCLVELVLWSEPNGLAARCARVAVEVDRA